MTQLIVWTVLWFALGIAVGGMIESSNCLRYFRGKR